MEEFIKHINIETLKQYSQPNNCVDDYLFMTDKLENILIGNKTVKMKVFMMMYCMEGEIDLMLNNEICHLTTDDLLVSLSNMVISKVLASPDYQVKIICLSGRFIQRLTQTEKYTWKSFHYLRKNPIKHFNEKEKSLFHQYLHLIEYKIAQESDPYRKEILLYLSSAFFTELIGATERKTIDFEKEMPKNVNRSDFIFKRFIEALGADNGRHRTLKYYAEKFCYSPKYLSRIVKQISGKNALTLIHEHTIERIMQELKYSSKSIKEIAEDFEFSNLSFFTQYVKKHLGVTPSEYRSNHPFVTESTDQNQKQL